MYSSCLNSIVSNSGCWTLNALSSLKALTPLSFRTTVPFLEWSIIFNFPPSLFTLRCLDDIVIFLGFISARPITTDSPSRRFAILFLILSGIFCMSITSFPTTKWESEEISWTSPFLKFAFATGTSGTIAFGRFLRLDSILFFKFLTVAQSGISANAASILAKSAFVLQFAMLASKRLTKANCSSLNGDLLTSETGTPGLTTTTSTSSSTTGLGSTGVGSAGLGSGFLVETCCAHGSTIPLGANVPRSPREFLYDKNPELPIWPSPTTLPEDFNPLSLKIFSKSCATVKNSSSFLKYIVNALPFCVPPFAVLSFSICSSKFLTVLNSTLCSRKYGIDNWAASAHSWGESA